LIWGKPAATASQHGDETGTSSITPSCPLLLLLLLLLLLMSLLDAAAIHTACHLCLP
jgi:hypothetical protein